MRHIIKMVASPTTTIINHSNIILSSSSVLDIFIHSRYILLTVLWAERTLAQFNFLSFREWSDFIVRLEPSHLNETFEFEFQFYFFANHFQPIPKASPRSFTLLYLDRKINFIYSITFRFSGLF